MGNSHSFCAQDGTREEIEQYVLTPNIHGHFAPESGSYPPRLPGKA
jgi:hypothetical protein